MDDVLPWMIMTGIAWICTFIALWFAKRAQRRSREILGDLIQLQDYCLGKDDPY